MKSKIVIKIFSCTCACLLSTYVFGQAPKIDTLKNNTVKKDTIYYLFDPSKIPVNDRMITLIDDPKDKYYTINCPCMSTYDRVIYLRSSVSRDTIVSKEKFSRLNLTSLPSLITLIKDNDSITFKDKYVIYIVMPKHERFILSRVFNFSAAGHGPVE